MRHRPPPSPDPAGPGQESVWSYPRPPLVEPTSRHLRVVFDGRLVAETRRAFRVLETSHPPVYYFPPDDIAPACLRSAPGASHCEWKGAARYFDVIGPDRIAEAAAWAYPNPTPAFRRIRNHVAFHPARMDACFVDDVQAVPQEGGFYGGWITPDVTGPFKGPPGSDYW